MGTMGSLVKHARSRRGALIVSGASFLVLAGFGPTSVQRLSLLAAATMLMTALFLMSIRLSQLHGQLESMRPAETIGSQEVSADPAVTVVVAANDASSIRDALDSVRAQTLSSWECVVVDDASTDDTLHIV